MTSMAWLADARSVTAVSWGHSKTWVVACALGGPMKTPASP